MCSSWFSAVTSPLGIIFSIISIWRLASVKNISSDLRPLSASLLLSLDVLQTEAAELFIIFDLYFLLRCVLNDSLKLFWQEQRTLTPVLILLFTSPSLPRAHINVGKVIYILVCFEFFRRLPLRDVVFKSSFLLLWLLSFVFISSCPF